MSYTCIVIKCNLMAIYMHFNMERVLPVMSVMDDMD